MKDSTIGPVIVIFGISGDLSQRKLLPALYHLLSHDLLPSDTRIIGTSRRPLAIDELLSKIELCVLEAQKVCDPAGLKKMRDSLELVQLDPTVSNNYDILANTLDKLDTKQRRERLLYMAIPPNAYTPIISQLGAHSLNDDRTRLLLEKPFGHDVASANELIAITNQHFEESQIYRIDHYLAKETAQNLLAFRLHNPIFTSLWSGEHIEKIHIKAIEKIGVENRINFYEETGALRDIIQSHLMQLLAITMMDQPIDNLSESIHEGKNAFLDSLAVADPTKATRGQYVGYQEEVNNLSSSTETYARIELSSKLTRWQDTKIVLESGKAMNEKITEIIIQFKHRHEKRRNQLRFRLQPDEGVSLDLVVKVPGFEDQMQHTELDFSYNNVFSNTGHPDAYERVIIDAVRGDQSLFASSQELVNSWKAVQPILDSWQSDLVAIVSYPKGSKTVHQD